MSPVRAQTGQNEDTGEGAQHQEQVQRSMSINNVNGLQECSIFVERVCSIVFLDIQGSNEKKFSITAWQR